MQKTMNGRLVPDDENPSWSGRLDFRGRIVQHLSKTCMWRNEYRVGKTSAKLVYNAANYILSKFTLYQLYTIMLSLPKS